MFGPTIILVEEPMEAFNCMFELAPAILMVDGVTAYLVEVAVEILGVAIVETFELTKSDV